MQIMATYPVHIPRKNYSGLNLKAQIQLAQRNRIAAEVQRYINSKLKAEIEHGRETDYQFLYCYMANQTGYDEQTIRDLCSDFKGGHGGFNVRLAGRELGTDRPSYL